MNPNHTPASYSPIGETQEASISEKIKEQALRHMPRGLSSKSKTHTCAKRKPCSVADFAAVNKAELRQFEKRLKRDTNRQRSREGQLRALDSIIAKEGGGK